jgi:hypothetical protein
MKPTFCCAFFVLGPLCLLTSLLSAQQSDPEQVAKGIVYLDQNNNRKFDGEDEPVAGVKVSNGRNITTTDKEGRYELPVDDDDILFVIKPRNMRTPLSDHKLPLFYYVHKPQGSPELGFAGVKPTGPLPESVDFPLYKQDEPEQFRAILFGDPQPRDQKEVDYIAHDVVEELIGTDASFGVTLGDIMFDDLKLFEPLNKTIALIGIPWYNVIGNHDINFDAKHDQHSDETFERIYGPSYYSFEYGQVHFIVLDDVEWYIPEDGGKGTYRGGLGKEQMEFLRQDLAMIPEDQLVVLMMHIPLTDVHDRQDLYRLIEKRPFCISISGHEHYHEHRFIKKEDGWMGAEPHHHIVNVTVSGSWWSGAPDERGIPHTMMRDGAPNGYSILSFDGTKYKLDFKAAGRPASYQLRIHAPEVVSTDQLAETIVFVNAFNGSARSKVEMQIGTGDWHALEHSNQVDPKYQAVFDAEAAILKDSPLWRKLSKPTPSSHLWKASLPDGTPVGTHLLRVRTTDMHGRKYTAQRVIRVVDDDPVSE